MVQYNKTDGNKYRLMNIQIFGKQKCFASKSGIRFFKERKIKYQFIDTQIKGMSKREIVNVLDCVKDIDLMFDPKCPLYESLHIEHQFRSLEDKINLLVENPRLLATPIVRDCDSRKCTVGDAVEEWKEWVKKSV